MSLKVDAASLQPLLERIERTARPVAAQGRVAEYIPALARAPSDRFAMAISLADGAEAAIGEADELFSIQSCSKIFTLAFALEIMGDALWERVGREPSGMSFNSLILLEQENGRPRNPLINAGAIATIDALLAHRPNWPDENLKRMRDLARDATIETDEEIFASEREHGDLNRAIAWFLKAKGNLRCAPDAVLDAYFRICATAMNARQMARAGRFLMGEDPEVSRCTRDQARRVRSIMRTCGMYDAAGDVAYRIGLPAKSGVGGGILAVSPGQFSVCVWSPALDEKGNSVAGLRALEMLVEEIAPDDWRG